MSISFQVMKISDWKFIFCLYTNSATLCNNQKKQKRKETKVKEHMHIFEKCKTLSKEWNSLFYSGKTNHYLTLGYSLCDVLISITRSKNCLLLKDMSKK